MRYMVKQGKRKELILLSVIYFFSQGMLIFASGRWWDDWCSYNQPTWVIKDMAFRMGRPSAFLITRFAKIMPENGYCIITFFMFYFCMLFLYRILRNWLRFSFSACFWICALYAVIPANDARIMLSVFPYTVGVFFFMAGMSYLSGLLYENQLNWKRRILNLTLFLFAFELNSNLCFYAIVLLMILMKEKNIRRFIGYIDYILLPLVYFIVKLKLFPPYSAYENYNSITLCGIIKAIEYIFPADFYMMKNLLNNYLHIGKVDINFTVIIVAVGIFLNIKNVICYFIKNGNRYKDNEIVLKRESMISLIMGIIVLSAGLFAYVAVRQSYSISTVNQNGRDATLVAFGAAMIFYGIVSLLFEKDLAYCFFTSFIVCGIIFFNIYYLSWQQDYYRQLGFRYQLEQHKEIDDAYNIVYLNNDNGIVNIQSTYVLNANAEIVFENQKKFFMSNPLAAALLEDNNALDYLTEKNSGYHMCDYNLNHKRIDAILQYSFDVDLKDVIKMKVYELINSSRFDSWIQNRSKMTIILDGTVEYEKVLTNAGYKNIE